MKLANPFKVHCSGIGAIMTDPKEKHPTAKMAELEASIRDATEKVNAWEAQGKTELKTYHTLKANIIKWTAEIPELKRLSSKPFLSKTCISYIHNFIKEQPEYYGRRKDFKSKYTDKGNFCEEESIAYASAYFGWGNVRKNEEVRENEFLIGCCDVPLPGSVEDIKNAWDQRTFPLFDTDIPIDGYGFQLQGYCELWDKPQGGLVYTLMDAPEWMIEKEAWIKAKSLGMDELDAELFDEVKESMTYSMFRDELRIKRFFLDRDKSVIESVYERVEECRKYIETI